MKPVFDKAKKVVIVETSKLIEVDQAYSKKVEYLPPTEDGTLPFDDDTFDVITCLSVLMYIDAYEHTIKELIRVLKPGGILLIREPSTDMHTELGSDRYGCGAGTRGFNFDEMKNYLNGFQGISFSIKHCLFSPWVVVGGRLIKGSLNKKWFVRTDGALCRLFAFNYHYHRKTVLNKFSPGAFYIRIEKEQ